MSTILVILHILTHMTPLEYFGLAVAFFIGAYLLVTEIEYRNYRKVMKGK